MDRDNLIPPGQGNPAHAGAGSSAYHAMAAKVRVFSICAGTPDTGLAPRLSLQVETAPVGLGHLPERIMAALA